MALVPTTWNPSDKGAGAALSGGNLTFSGNVNSACRSSFSAASGKWYWEVTLGAGTYPVAVGIGKAGAALNDYVGSDANSIGWYGNIPDYYVNGSATTYGTTSGRGAVISVLLDLDGGTLALWRNGVSMGTMVSGLSGAWYAMVSGNQDSSSYGTANFGATAFAYTPPAGFQPEFGVVTIALSGTVRDATNALAARKVAAYREDTNALVGTTTSDATTGAYSITTPTDTAHTLVFYPALGENLNALVLRGVLPVES